MNKPVYLGLLILRVRKTVTHEFWYNHVKPKYGEKAKLCYIDTDGFLSYIKTEDITEDIEERLQTSNHETTERRE